MSNKIENVKQDTASGPLPKGHDAQVSALAAKVKAGKDGRSDSSK